MDLKKLTRTARKALPLKNCGVVIVAAGSASRMKGIDKVMTELGGCPVLERTVSAFQNCDAVKSIVVVTREDLIRPVAAMTRYFDKVIAVVAGGKDRAESVSLGLNALPKETKLAAVHDGARPLADPQLIDRVIRAANTYGAAAPGIPVKDTIKVVNGGIVAATPDRSRLKAIQTPQVFDMDLLRGALKKAADDKTPITDDCSAVELMGFKVRIVEGDECNLKITTPMDLQIAELYLSQKGEKL